MDSLEAGARRVMRRCGRCRLLFEAEESAHKCVACGEPVLGLALPLMQEPIPVEVTEKEPTSPRELKARI